MKFNLLIVTLLCSFFSRGQVSLISEDFGTTANNPITRTGWTANAASGSNWETRTTSPSSGYTWTSPAAAASGSANAFTNLGTNTNTKTLTYDNSLSTVGYNTLAVRVAGLKSGTVPNIDVSYSTDGVGYTSAGTITLTTTWAAYTVSLPAGAESVANLRIRFSVVANNNATNFIRLDDFQVIGNLPASYSGVTAGSGSEPATISSLINTLGAASLNFDFTVTDDANTVAANDALPTLISQIVIPQGAGNDIADWTQAIAGAQLSDGVNVLNGTINATNITFPSIPTGALGNVPDGTTKTYTLRIFLNTTLGGTLPDNIDGWNFAFKIDRTNFTTASIATSTQFETGAGTVVESGSTNNEVTVVTTKLTCNTAGNTQYVNTNFIPTLPIIKAQDANNNLDKNYTSNVTVTNSGALGMTTVPAAFSAGIINFSSSFQYTAAGIGTLTVAENPSAGITDAVSNTITVYNSLVTVTLGTTVAAANVLQSATNVILTNGLLTATNGNAVLNSVALITGGTYLAADIQTGGLKLWVNTTNTFGSATQIGAGLTSTKSGANETLTFTGFTQAVNVGTPIYFWLTADIAATATPGRTLRKEVTNGTDFSFTTSVNKAGTYAVGGLQTIVALAPEINVVFGATNIVDGDITPSAAEGTTYTAAVGSSITRTYTIQNTLGTAPLIISSIVFSGANAANFSVTTAPSSPIAAGATTTFIVTFTPPSAGVFNATITINNNDGYDANNETVYDFALQGTGTASAASDLVYVAASSPATISSTVNDASPLTSVTGVQVMQFQLRDGGGTTDADNLGTTLTGFTLTQVSNTATDWLQAIRTIELFDGATNVGIGVITATTVTFSSLNVAVADGANKILSLRMSLNCPLGTVTDGEYFGFSIANGTTTVSASGSTMSAFTAVRNTPNAGGTLRIAVVATELTFTQQPITTGVSSAMSNVVLTARDACGNRDKDFTTAVVVTSSGTMTGSPLTVNAVAGVATFSGIIHTVVGTNLTLTATSSLPIATSTTFDISTVTVLKPGDLAILAVNTTAESTGSADEISFVCFQDLLPGTTIYLTDNGYERVSAGLWGNTEGIISMTRTTSSLARGTVITIHTQDGGVNSGTKFTIYTCGSVDSNWTKGVASSAGSFFDLNKDDQVWITQGGAWTNVGTGNHDTAYSGNVLYGWTDIPWKTAPAWDLANGSKGSTVYPLMTCFTTDVANAETGASQVKFNDPVNPDFSTTTNDKIDWIALINNPANWNYYSSDAAFDSGGYNYYGSTSCPVMTIASGTYINGKWTGRKDTNWFNCGNWDTFLVPDATVDVEVGDNIFNNQAKIDATATYASEYGGIAKSKNLTITGEKVEIVGSANNKLEVHGNLLIDSPAGALDMDDSSSATADGQIYLYGNWTNNRGNASFEEGNGTVQFVGTAPQIINNVTPEGTETFYNVVLDNNFDTAVSNDLIATGNLTTSAGRNISIDSNGYIQVNKKLTHNGNITIENNGQFVQVDEADINDGTYTGTKFQVKRTAHVKHFDYVYWSSPTENVPVSTLPGNNRYEWDTLYPNANGTLGYWINPTTANMVKGKGYIARASNGASTVQDLTATFSQKPHNGQFTFPINRGTYTGPDYDADPGNATNALTTKFDDNWNLVGNPYPSAIDAEEFLVLNQTKIEGTVWIWKHGFDPSLSGSPFYTNYLYNYSATSDLIKYNGLGSSEPDSFAGSIASGQGFLVSMKDTAAQPGSTITFNNALRKGSVAASGLYDNTDFFRNSSSNHAMTSTRPVEDKSRIWLDIVNPTTGSLDRTLLGYSTSSTLGRDQMYDCFNVIKNELTLYSLIDSDPFIIQGRPLPFDKTDMVPMGVKIANAGTHKIAIKKLDGLFSNPDQNIYLEDKDLNIIHDLRQAPYTFNSETGQFDHRFVLRYTNQALSNNGFEKVDNNVIVAANKNEITIKSYIENMNEIIVYDALGRTIFESNAINNKIFSIKNINADQQVLMVKIKLVNGQTVTKKILF